MNPKKLAEAYRTLSMGYAELADAYLDEPETIATRINEAKEKIGEAFAAPSFDELPPDEGDQWAEFAAEKSAVHSQAPAPEGSAAVCPKHRVPYSDGKFGPYCRMQSTDQDGWVNSKGYCRITPKNAAAYLRERASVTA